MYVLLLVGQSFFRKILIHKNEARLLFVYFKILTKYDLFCVASLNEDHFNIFSCSSNHVYLNNLNHYSLGSSKSLYSFILRNFSHIRATTWNWRKQFLLQLQCRAKILGDITNITDRIFEVWKTRHPNTLFTNYLIYYQWKIDKSNILQARILFRLMSLE